ncbi:MAG TPA: GtrA family protein [Caulobacteraceae bacterium]|nr:GtrA family protein [Caulobacteraceae bacterium]HUO13080.1 GtrA family protein [Caulobacteraceae bacterium]
MNRLLRFGLTGLLTTAIAYVVMAGLMRVGVFYLVAATASWAASLCVGFAINRRFTFQIRGAAQSKRDFGFYVLGAVLQLLVGWAGYGVLIGELHLRVTPAFAINLVFTTGFSFLFMRFVTFRRAAQPIQPAD